MKKKINRIESLSEEQKILQKILNEKKHIEQGLSAEYPPLPAVSEAQW